MRTRILKTPTRKRIIRTPLKTCGSARLLLSERSFKLADDAEEGDKVRFQRRVLFYRELLSEAGFGKPPHTEAKLKGLFNEGLRKALRSGKGKDPDRYQASAAILDKNSASWTEVA